MAVDEADEVLVVEVVGYGAERRGVPLVGDVGFVVAEGEDEAEVVFTVVETQAGGYGPQFGVAVEEAGELLRAVAIAIVEVGIFVVGVDVLVGYAWAYGEFAPGVVIAEVDVVCARGKDLLGLDLVAWAAYGVVFGAGGVIGEEAEVVDTAGEVDVAFFEVALVEGVGVDEEGGLRDVVVGVSAGEVEADVVVGGYSEVAVNAEGFAGEVGVAEEVVCVFVFFGDCGVGAVVVACGGEV